MVLLNEATKARSAKELALGVGGFGDPIGMKDKNVADVEGDAPLVILNFLPDVSTLPSNTVVPVSFL